MKAKLILIILIISVSLSNAQTKTVFFDNFNGTSMNTALWHIPTWVSSTDGTYIGRTQFRCSQNSGLPTVNSSQAILNLETFNPTGFSFYGTDLISNREFSPGDGLIFTIRAKINTPLSGGIVGGIFLYDLTGSGTNHDEIDCELLSNRLNEMQTNIYAEEPLGSGHPLFESITGSITDFHTYVMKWLPDEVTWIIDGNVIRTDTKYVPAGPMHFHLNIWAPDAGWAAAYDNNLQPVTSVDLNQIYSMTVDSVRVDSLVKPLSDLKIKYQEVKNIFYPNPAHDLIYFTTPGEICITIYNLVGDIILDNKEITNGSLSIENLPRGLFIVKSEQKGIVVISKLITY
jgi:beta-glucanase (GH16 family)